MREERHAGNRAPSHCPGPESVYSIHMKSLDVLRLLKADGWEAVHQVGDHVKLKHPTKPGHVTVPHPKKDIPKGTLRSIEKQAGLKLR